MDRPLREDERRQMVAEISQAKADNDLRASVATLGSAQYLIVPAAFLCSGALLYRRRERHVKLVAGASIAVAALSGFFMIYRGYFSSLGW